MLNAQLLMVFISKKTNNPNPSPTEMRFGLFFFGEGVLIGLFKKADFPRCFLISEQRISYFSLHIPSQQEVYSHSLRNVPKLPEGLSHGLKTCHRHVFYGLSSPFRHKQIPGHSLRNALEFGTVVLIGLFEKPCHTNVFLDFRASNFLFFHFT